MEYTVTSSCEMWASPTWAETVSEVREQSDEHAVAEGGSLGSSHSHPSKE
jgi:hypothetical protein